MIKIISIVGARPNFMKVAPIHRAFLKHLDKVDHKIVHTGQHYDFEMSTAFFQDLEMPEPAYFLNIGSASHAVQTAKIMIEFEKVCLDEKPDLVIVVGDVNSTIACSLTAEKLGIKTAHIEAGLRSFDRTMPEELNRLATDAISDYLFITEESALKNLTHEGVENSKIFFVGNTMIDSLVFALPKSDNSKVLKRLEIEENEFVLATIHRPSNVDIPEQLDSLLDLFKFISEKKKIVFPVHPRTKKMIEANSLLVSKVESIENLILTEPLGYVDFLKLMRTCDFVITDSGGIQEETTFLLKPCITMRTSTERPSTIELGTNILVNPDFNSLKNEVTKILNNERKQGVVPPLWDGNTADRIADIIINKLFK
jgi:UDP-N-acetylglucosamine 2-epimerase (non-hydrolysing)